MNILCSNLLLFCVSLFQHNILFIVSQPEAENETNRIEAAGGRVICWDGYRVGGFLALSRAIGLLEAHLFVL